MSSAETPVSSKTVYSSHWSSKDTDTKAQSSIKSLLKVRRNYLAWQLAHRLKKYIFCRTKKNNTTVSFFYEKQKQKNMAGFHNDITKACPPIDGHAGRPNIDAIIARVKKNLPLYLQLNKPVVATNFSIVILDR